MPFDKVDMHLRSLKSYTTVEGMRSHYRTSGPDLSELSERDRRGYLVEAAGIMNRKRTEEELIVRTYNSSASNVYDFMKKTGLGFTKVMPVLQSAWKNGRIKRGRFDRALAEQTDGIDLIERLYSTNHSSRKTAKEFTEMTGMHVSPSTVLNVLNGNKKAIAEMIQKAEEQRMLEATYVVPRGPLTEAEKTDREMGALFPDANGIRYGPGVDITPETLRSMKIRQARPN
jgi:hypothetical protein